MEKDLYLVLENGKVFKGKSFGYEGEVTAEIVFCTGMTGYLETLTDKSYSGQIITQTFPLIGNYGVIPSDFEGGKIYASGYIVRDYCREPSNFRSEGVLDEFLKSQKTVGLYGIDTRALTRILRTQGVMNGRITFDPASVNLDEIKKYKIKKAVEKVSINAAGQFPLSGSRYNVALIDTGMKESIIKELQNFNCSVTVFPYNTNAEEILKSGANGVMLSDGPGDPADNTEIIQNIKKLFAARIPMFGTGLGHQLMALAAGFKTRKLKYGHRGSNQPVKSIKTGRVYITGQNHGYEVVADSIDSAKAELEFINVNDGSCEGIEYKNCPAFSAQFRPDAGAGPNGTGFLFERFTALMAKK